MLISRNGTLHLLICMVALCCGVSGGWVQGQISSGAVTTSEGATLYRTFVQTPVVGSSNPASAITIDGEVIVEGDFPVPQASNPIPNSVVPSLPQTTLQSVAPSTTGSMAFDAPLVAPDIYLTMRVPEEAKIFVNGDPTAAEGVCRYFVVRHLEFGRTYKFKIAVETKNAAGVPLEETKTLVLSPGARESLAFNPYKKKKEVKEDPEGEAEEEDSETEEPEDDEEEDAGDGEL